jgi:alginate O-acetyltransferase complex protein AlgI
MNFTESAFLVFLGLTWLVSVILKNHPSAREWFLVGCSLFVILSWGVYDCSIFLVITGLNYCAVKFLSKGVPYKSKMLLPAVILFNILSLLFFKYRTLLGLNEKLFASSSSIFSVGIPLAISFYTFHIISLMTDLYSGRIENISFRAYCFYLSFFPHVIAGPIIRAKQLVPQIGRVFSPTQGFAKGLQYLITGFFLKVVLADNIGIGIDDLWCSPIELSGGDRWLLVFLFYCQIYGDFAGYSLMAIGMARLLGYRFPANFRGPMAALTLRHFWQRWHITLSQFLRDYLYIPLGGSRSSKSWALCAVMATMLVAGLWHGPSWSFVVWGGIHGIGIIAERIIKKPVFRYAKVNSLISLLLTQLFVTFSWVFFRISNVDEALHFAKRMFALDLSKSLFTKPYLLGLMIFAVPIIIHNLVPFAIRKIRRSYIPGVLGAFTGMMLLANICTLTKKTVFIYFKF